MQDTLRGALARWKIARIEAEEARSQRLLADAQAGIPVNSTPMDAKEIELWRVEGTKHGEFFSLIEAVDTGLGDLFGDIGEMQVHSDKHKERQWFGPFSAFNFDKEGYVTIEWPNLMLSFEWLKNALTLKS